MAMKVLTPDEVSEIVGVSTATLERYRNDGEGPNFLRIGPGGLIKYLESDVEEWLMAQRQLPTAAERMRAAATHGLKEASAAVRTRMQELADASKPEGEANPYAVTMSGVGDTPGSKFERFNSVPTQSFETPAAPPHILNCR